MDTNQILAEIREANLSYLMLAQSLIRADREQALFRLGISEETANLMASLTPAQMMKMATGNTLLCRFRMDDDLVWSLLTSHGKSGGIMRPSLAPTVNIPMTAPKESQAETLRAALGSQTTITPAARPKRFQGFAPRAVA